MLASHEIQPKQKHTSMEAVNRACFDNPPQENTIEPS